MRIPTVTVDRGGVAVVINAKDFRQGVDVLFGDPAPAAVAVAAPDETDAERRRLFDALNELGIKPGGRTSNEKLRLMLAEATVEAITTDTPTAPVSDPAAEF
jgi:hypothetical protein